MSFIKTVMAGVAVVALAGGVALAQDDHHDDAHPAAHAPAHPEAHPGPVNHPVQNHETVQNHEVVQNHTTVINRDVPRPAGGGHHWANGDHFTGNRVVISDWGHHPHLYAPPDGYEWVQDDDGEFVLIAISTGIVANIIID